MCRLIRLIYNCSAAFTASEKTVKPKAELLRFQEAFKELEDEGMKLTPELAAAFTPYRTHHVNRFGVYELRERNLEPIDYGVTFRM